TEATLRVGRADVIGPYPAVEPLSDRGAAQQSVAHAVGVVLAAEERILLRRECSDSAQAQPVLGDMTEAAAPALSDRWRGRLAAAEPNGARAQGPEADQCLDELRLSIPRDARDPHDLAGANGEAHAVEAPDALRVDDRHRLDLEHRCAGRSGRFRRGSRRP